MRSITPSESYSPLKTKSGVHITMSEDEQFKDFCAGNDMNLKSSFRHDWLRPMGEFPCIAQESIWGFRGNVGPGTYSCACQKLESI